MAFKLFN